MASSRVARGARFEERVGSTRPTPLVRNSEVLRARSSPANGLETGMMAAAFGTHQAWCLGASHALLWSASFEQPPIADPRSRLSALRIPSRSAHSLREPITSQPRLASLFEPEDSELSPRIFWPVTGTSGAVDRGTHGSCRQACPRRDQPPTPRRAGRGLRDRRSIMGRPHLLLSG